MATPKRNAMLHDEARKKIQTTQLIKRLSANALGQIDPELSSGQIKSIEILLRKSIPDLAAVTLSGDSENPIAVEDVTDTRELARRVALLLTRAEKTR